MSPRSSARSSNSATLTVASAAPFRVGYTLTIPQTNANGTITSTTRVITNIAGNVLTLATPVATTAGQSVANGAVVNLACSTANPTPYAEWPDPTVGDSTLRLGRQRRRARRARLRPGRGGDARSWSTTRRVTATTLMNAASEDSRLLYVTNPLTSDVRISGTPKVSLNVAFSRRRRT